MTNHNHSNDTGVDPIKAGILGRCPHCGEGKLFSGFLTVAKSCHVCGQDYSFADSGDGPVVFVILIIGFIVLGLALWLEANFQPALWVYLITLIPLAIILSLGLVRCLKGVLITLQFKHKAAPGRIDDGQ
ncbi:DUF983 domain-containing protein [Brucellaceae bacterium C25G]